MAKWRVCVRYETTAIYEVEADSEEAAVEEAEDKVLWHHKTPISEEITKIETEYVDCPEARWRVKAGGIKPQVN